MDDIAPTGQTFGSQISVRNNVFSAGSTVRPGDTRLRDRIARVAAQENDLGEEITPSDASYVTARPFDYDTVGTIGTANGTSATLNRSESEAGTEAYAKAFTFGTTFASSQSESEARILTVSKPASDIQATTELYWKSDNEANVSDAESMGEAYIQKRTLVATDTQSETLAANGVSGYGNGGYGQGGYGGNTTYTG